MRFASDLSSDILGDLDPTNDNADDEPGNSSNPDDETGLLSFRLEALRHVWAFYAHQDDHRLTMFRFFLLTFAALTAVFLQKSFLDEEFGISIFVALLAFVCATIFRRLDYRSQQLLGRSKNALKILQNDLSKRLAIPALRLVESNQVPNGKHRTFNTLLPLFFWMARWTSLLAMIFVIFFHWPTVARDVRQAYRDARCTYAAALPTLPSAVRDSFRLTVPDRTGCVPGGTGKPVSEPSGNGASRRKH